MIPDTLASKFIFETADTYHAAAKDYLSSHQLADFRRCPLLYQWKQLGLAKDKDRPAYFLGRAAHTLILEGREKFLAEYAIGDGPINKTTGKPYKSDSQAYQKWAEVQGKPVLSEDQAKELEQLAAGVMGHDLARQLLVLGIAEPVLRTRWHEVDCQIRVDWFTHMAGGAIVDLKTCDHLDYFEVDARKFRYAHQLAFYRSISAAAAGTDPRELPVHLIAIEKQPPFRCGVWRVGEDVLAIAQKENEEAVKRLRHCRKTNVWPTGYEELRTFDWL
ncbi:MAG TPA: PD-(D/E)XK nuclease-like domain-containing protein [Phycisphaerae bacterium]|nr:PD-(D/E)XK nuclease-like domain-containing protein [Phycisphaerae bacterium]